MLISTDFITISCKIKYFYYKIREKQALQVVSLSFPTMQCGSIQAKWTCVRHAWEPWQPMTYQSNGISLICSPSGYLITPRHVLLSVSCLPTEPESGTMGALSETTGAAESFILKSWLRIGKTEAAEASERIKWSAGGGGDAAVLGFPLTSSRWVSSQVGGHSGAWNLVHALQVPACLGSHGISA